MKLSKKLIEILTLMNSGWQLGKSKGQYFGWWLQKGGCGKGGEAKHLHGRIKVYVLIREGLIKSDGDTFPTEKYHLTEKGKEFLK